MCTPYSSCRNFIFDIKQITSNVSFWGKKAEFAGVIKFLGWFSSKKSLNWYNKTECTKKIGQDWAFSFYNGIFQGLGILERYILVHLTSDMHLWGLIEGEILQQNWISEAENGLASTGVIVDKNMCNLTILQLCQFSENFRKSKNLKIRPKILWDSKFEICPKISETTFVLTQAFLKLNESSYKSSKMYQARDWSSASEIWYTMSKIASHNLNRVLFQKIWSDSIGITYCITSWLFQVVRNGILKERC